MSPDKLYSAAAMKAIATRRELDEDTMAIIDDFIRPEAEERHRKVNLIFSSRENANITDIILTDLGYKVDVTEEDVWYMLSTPGTFSLTISW